MNAAQCSNEDTEITSPDSPDKLNDADLDDVQGAAAPKLMENVSNGVVFKVGKTATFKDASDSRASDDVKVEFQFYRPSHGHG